MSSSFGSIMGMAYGESRPQGGKLSGREIRRVAHYFRPYWSDSAWITVCILVTSVIGLVPPLLVRHLIDHDVQARDVSGLFRDVGFMVLLPAVGGLIGVLQNYLAVRVGQAVMFDIRNEMYGGLLRQSLRFFTNTKSGEILTRVQSDVGGIQGV